MNISQDFVISVVIEDCLIFSTNTTTSFISGEGDIGVYTKRAPLPIRRAFSSTGVKGSCLSVGSLLNWWASS